MVAAPVRLGANSELAVSTKSTGNAVREFLEEHPNFDAAERELSPEKRNERLASVGQSELAKWISEIDATGRVGVQQAWMVGRVLNAKRAQLPHGQVTAWEKSVCEKTGKKPRILQLYRQVAEGLDHPEFATALRKEHLDGGLNAVIRRIRNVASGRPPDYKKPKADKDRRIELAVDALDRAATRVGKLLGATWVVTWSMDKLPALLAAVVAGKPTHESDAAEPHNVETTATLPEVMAPDEFARKLATMIAAADNTVDAAEKSELDSLVEDILAATRGPESDSVASNADRGSAE
jgi:hypothetical protein